MVKINQRMDIMSQESGRKIVFLPLVNKKREIVFASSRSEFGLGIRTD